MQTYLVSLCAFMLETFILGTAILSVVILYMVVLKTEASPLIANSNMCLYQSCSKEYVSFALSTGRGA